jgi:hypothetical protein
VDNSIEEHETRLKNFYKIDEQTWTSITDLGSGILVYHDILRPNLNIINRLEEVASDSSNYYNYSEAMVGYGMKIPEYRDCFDLKFKKTDIEHDTSEASKKLQSLWDDVHFNKLQAVKDYSKKFNIGELRYWEALNFVKYGPGQHFQEHTDHGFSYNCVVSLVGYPNDDYEGGEIYFRMQGVRVKPRAGDLFIFPSNYMYPHQAMPVISGTKYSIVTMLDYSNKFHNENFYEETGG